jgi:hypothetical protein
MVMQTDLLARLAQRLRGYAASIVRARDPSMASLADDLDEAADAIIAALRAGDALEGYRAAASYIGADSWDRCTDCFDILRMARAADYDWYWTPDEVASALKRLRDRSGQTALPTPPAKETPND